MKWICQKSAETLTIPVTTEYLVVVYSPDCFITRHILVQKNNLITFPNFWGQSRHKKFFWPLSYDARTEIKAVCHSLNILVPLVQIKKEWRGSWFMRSHYSMHYQPGHALHHKLGLTYFPDSMKNSSQTGTFSFSIEFTLSTNYWIVITGD